MSKQLRIEHTRKKDFAGSKIVGTAANSLYRLGLLVLDPIPIGHYMPLACLRNTIEEVSLNDTGHVGVLLPADRWRFLPAGKNAYISATVLPTEPDEWYTIEWAPNYEVHPSGRVRIIDTGMDVTPHMSGGSYAAFAMKMDYRRTTVTWKTIQRSIPSDIWRVENAL